MTFWLAPGLTLLLATAPLAGRAAQPVSPDLPPATARPVDFAKEVKPLFEANCLSCHAHGQKKGGLRLDDRNLLLQGGESGPAAKPGHSAESLIVKLVAGADPDRIMPQSGPRWTAAQIGLLRAWIDQGMVWDTNIKLARGYQAPVAPRRPELPSATKELQNPIDRLLAPYFAQQAFRPPALVGDAVFARRVYFDTIGLPPTPSELSAFVKDRAPDKRERLIKRLLGDHQRYAEHWLSFWNDALRNDYRGTGYIDGGRKQITPWLYQALAENLPFDRFVAALVNPDEHSEGFTKGIVWRGAVNASQQPPVQAAQSLSQVFLGINLKCASCHDSFVSSWKLADAYGLASVYAEEPLELVRCDKPMGIKAERKFLFPELGSVLDSTNRQERLASLASIVTQPNNGRLTRTYVNRLWARLMGRGLVEPVDEMDTEPWNRDLLDWLAVDLVDHGYDTKHTLSLILTSRAYQLPSVGQTEEIQSHFVFKGPSVRRLSAEQFLDTLSSLTGTWGALPANTQIDFSVGSSPSVDPPPAAEWIWCEPGGATAVPPRKAAFRKVFVLLSQPETALITTAADNRFTVAINGHEVGSGDDWKKPKVIDIRNHLIVGTNVLTVLAENDRSSKDDSSPNPAGLILRARIRDAASGGKMDFGTDPSWIWSTNAVDQWLSASTTLTDWHAVFTAAPEEASPWSLRPALRASWSVTAQHQRVRAALLNNDPLMASLGRPSREQILTSRSPTATTLQALELTNGSTLAQRLHQGVTKLASNSKVPPRRLISSLYEGGLGRRPTSQELRLAEQTLGTPIRPEALEDLMWALSMQPEFQLIY